MTILKFDFDNTDWVDLIQNAWGQGVFWIVHLFRFCNICIYTLKYPGGGDPSSDTKLTYAHIYFAHIIWNAYHILECLLFDCNPSQEGRCGIFHLWYWKKKQQPILMYFACQIFGLGDIQPVQKCDAEYDPIYKVKKTIIAPGKEGSYSDRRVVAMMRATWGRRFREGQVIAKGPKRRLRSSHALLLPPSGGFCGRSHFDYSPAYKQTFHTFFWM